MANRSLFDLEHDQSDPFKRYKAEKEEARVAEQEEAQLLVDFHNTFNDHNSGKRIFNWLIAQCEVYGEPNATNFGEASQFIGKRSIGLLLIEKMEQIRNEDDIMNFFREVHEDKKGEEE